MDIWQSASFPGKPVISKLPFLRILSQYIISENSFVSLQEERFREVIKLYIEFIDKYPQSPFIMEAEKMYVESLYLLTKFAK